LGSAADDEEADDEEEDDQGAIIATAEPGVSSKGWMA